MKKILLIISISYLITACIEKKKNEKTVDIQWQLFSWINQEVGGVYFEKMGIAIPLEMENIAYPFKCQVDLGQNEIELFDNVIYQLEKQVPELTSKIERASDSAILFGNASSKLKNVKLETEGVTFSGDAELISHFKNSDSSAFLFVDDTVLIGSIGSTFFKNKKLIIDYKNEKFAVVDTLPNQFANADNYSSMLILNNKLLIPFQINGSFKNLLFDSRSAMFSFLTTQETWNELIDTINPDIDYVSIAALGTEYKVYSGLSSAEMYLGKKVIKSENQKIFYPVRQEFAEYLNSFNAYGVVGAPFFEDNTIVVDYEEMKFGVF